MALDAGGFAEPGVPLPRHPATGQVVRVDFGYPAWGPDSQNQRAQAVFWPANGFGSPVGLRCSSNGSSLLVNAFTPAGVIDNNTCVALRPGSGVDLAANGFLRWSNNSGQPLTTLDIGLARSAAGILEVNNGALGTYRDLRVRNLLAVGGNGSYVQIPSMTVANLPAAATATAAGAVGRAFATDANTTLAAGIGTTVVGGGANLVPVYSDGTNWIIG